MFTGGHDQLIDIHGQRIFMESNLNYFIIPKYIWTLVKAKNGFSIGFVITNSPTNQDISNMCQTHPDFNNICANIKSESGDTTAILNCCSYDGLIRMLGYVPGTEYFSG